MNGEWGRDGMRECGRGGNVMMGRSAGRVGGEKEGKGKERWREERKKGEGVKMG